MPEPTWSTACLDWKRRIRERRSLIPFRPLFPASAEQKMAVFTSLRIVDLPGQPTFGEASDEWLLDFAAAVFGAFDPETAQQVIKEYLLLISKKNTKSTLAAGIMLTELACGFRAYDRNLILAPTKEVAGNSFDPAVGMIEADEELKDLLHHQDHLKLITHREMKSTLKVLAADSATVAGTKASRVLVDELWLFGEMANADSMLKEATGGQVSRPEGYTIYLTTQSDKPPAGVFKSKLALFRDIRDGKVIDKRKLPVLYEYPEEMVAKGEHLDRANFYVTNPNMGRSVTQEWLEDKAAEADLDADGPKAVFYAKETNIAKAAAK
ncbi:Phage Terminase [Sphingomonas gellani]|uniref:Phage Terminase n=1 Tax=Sphingomonas gellani TaxID=1166340 RepID=A0A1H7Z873_9SPHN|nr:terminase large subunit [Sphingomonas gellani]SEM54413.1 Phage Terminase [Sphingomonas gellani]